MPVGVVVQHQNIELWGGMMVDGKRRTVCLYNANVGIEFEFSRIIRVARKQSYKWSVV